MELRACRCSFCRKHNTRAAADPKGQITITVTDPALLNRYSFGYRTAEYLLCRDCGVYVAAVTLDSEASPRALVIVNALESGMTTSPAKRWRSATTVKTSAARIEAKASHRLDTGHVSRYGALPTPKHPA